MTRTALVTGASGFLGGHVVADLRAHGYRVIAAGRNTAALPTGGATLVGDLVALGRTNQRADVVIHCAALSTLCGRWRAFAHPDVPGTEQVLTYARAHATQRSVHVTSTIICTAARHATDITESQVDTTNRLTVYIRSDRAAWLLLQRARRRPSTPETVTVRARGIVGPGDPSLVPRLLAV